MTLGARLFLALAFSLLVVAAVTAFTFRLVFLGTFEDLEDDQLTRTAVETRRQAMDMIGAVVSPAVEAALLPEVAEFLETRNVDIAWSLVESSVWACDGLEAIAVYDSSGGLAFASGLVEGSASAPFPAGLTAEISRSEFSVPRDVGGTRGGILFAGRSAWIIGTCEVRPSPGSGEPTGMVLFADRLDGAAIGRLNLIPGNTTDVLAPEAGPHGLSGEGPGEMIIRTGPDSAVVYATLGEGPGLDVILKIGSPREIYGLGRDSADRVMLMVLLSGVFFVAVTILLFQGVVMAPLRRLTHRIAEIGVSGDPAMRSGIGGSDELGLLASTLDGTLDELEKASADLRQSRSRFDLFARYLPGYSYIRKPDGKLVYANDGFRRDLLGAREDWEGMDWGEIWPAEQASVIGRSDDEALRSRRPVLTELDVRIGSKGVRRLLFHSFPIGPDHEGNLLLGGIATDVTDRARIEERLLSSEMRNEAILSAIPESVLVISHDGRILEFKAGSSAPAQLMRERMEGGSLEEAGLPAEDLARGREALSRCLRLRSVETVEITFPSGPVSGVYECRLAPFENDSVVCILRNVTEERRMEAELLNAQKQESLSLMAGGIAHDFKNIMSAVTGNIDLGMTSEPGTAETAGYLKSALEACDKALLMLKQLEMLSRGTSVSERWRVDLGAMLESTARLVLSGSGISLSVSPAPGLWAVEADEGQMVQAFSNFIVNAREAMNGSGRLEIRLWNAVARSGDREVKVSIRDTGPGIQNDVIERVFDPYFSTKARGTGLGLAVTASILKQHGGRIEVESTPGAGATFTVTLPAA